MKADFLPDQGRLTRKLADLVYQSCQWSSNGVWQICRQRRVAGCCEVGKKGAWISVEEAGEARHVDEASLNAFGAVRVQREGTAGRKKAEDQSLVSKGSRVIERQLRLHFHLYKQEERLTKSSKCMVCAMSTVPRTSS